MSDNHNKNKRGTSLKDKELHQKDHNKWSRRGFIQTLGLATGAGMGLGGFSLNAMASSALIPMLTTGIDDRVLVLIRLKGGNDGLNTIVPLFDYGTYSGARPTIAHAQNAVTPLDNLGAFGVPASMDSILPMWNSGSMKVVNSVGYDNHNLSHFSSTDIWNSADPMLSTNPDKSGWLGRYILNENPDYLENLPSIPGAIKISSGSAIAYHNPDEIDLAVNFNTPDRLLEIAQNGFVYDTQNLPDDCYYGEQVGFLRTLLNVTFNYAPQISDAYNTGINEVNYGNSDLARQLALVARLIKGNLGTKLYMVTIDGFDTHENQNTNHANLLNALSSSINNFYEDLALGSKAEDVLSMTFSEFGRRIAENNGGTDHGTAAPVMLFGPALNGNGIFGDDPDLSDVDANGNLKHGTDFRSLYATLLEYWLCLDAEGVDMILGDTFDRMPELGFDCSTVGVKNTPVAQSITHGIRPDGMGGMIISYETMRPGPIAVSVYSVMGQKISDLYNGYQPAGKHEVRYVNQHIGLSTFPLVYRIASGNKQYAGKFVMSN